ncbi:MAG: DUF4097 family beta strand repeat-containing protein [Dermatophilaceae bacterium]
MAQNWQIDGPRVLDVGGENEQVSALVVGLVGGHVDIVTHDDSPGARVEVSEVEGLPLQVSWDGRTLKVMHGKESNQTLMEALRRIIENFGRNRATVSISVPADAKVTVSTVSASAVISGPRRGVTTNTVSGSLTLSEIEGKVNVNTVSGNTECVGLHGETRLVSVSGDITVQSSSITTAKLNTVSGDVALDLTNASAQLASNSVSGDITVRAPFTGYAVTANTASGHVVIDGRSLGRATGTKQSGANGTLRSGDESLQLKANAVSGDVTVLRATAAAGAGPQDAASSPPETDPAPQDAPPQDAPPQQWSEGQAP